MRKDTDDFPIIDVKERPKLAAMLAIASAILKGEQSDDPVQEAQRYFQSHFRFVSGGEWPQHLSDSGKE